MVGYRSGIAPGSVTGTLCIGGKKSDRPRKKEQNTLHRVKKYLDDVNNPMLIMVWVVMSLFGPGRLNGVEGTTQQNIR